MSRPFCCHNRTAHQAKQPARARCRPACTKDPEGHDRSRQRRSERTRQHARTRTPAAPETTMPNTTRGVGLFTAENIVAAIRAIPESDGTYRDVASKAEQYGGYFRHHTLSNWASHGRADIGSRPTVHRLRQIHQTVPRPDCRALQTRQQPEPRIRPGARDPKRDLRVRQRQSVDA